MLLGTYEFTITAVSDSDSTIEAHYTLYIEVKHLCEQTVLTITPLGTIMQRTGLPAYTYQVQTLDTVSQSNGNSDGYTYCGLRTYSMTPTIYPLTSISATGLLTV